MTAPDTSTGRAIVKTVHASLSLVSSSSELLTLSQLYAVRNELLVALAITNSKIRVGKSSLSFTTILKYPATNLHSTGEKKEVIDISNWDATSDEESEQDKGDPCTLQIPL
jgi:hypothetical protein